MALKKYKPTSAGRRFQTCSTFDEITKSEPEKSLVQPLKSQAGRNSYGRVTVRHQGAGHKRQYRVIDFKRDKLNIPAKVASIEYDPNRSARIALLHYADGEKRYILAPQNMQVGATVIAGDSVEIRDGNCLPLRFIPPGTSIHNIELKRGKGGQMVRSAGSHAEIMAKEGAYAQVRLPSGEVRKIHMDCTATIGQLSNIEHENISIGKAGRQRWMGVRPSVRGVAMNPIDHPLGGGEGKTSGGRHPVTPWGKCTRGMKTRNNKSTDSFIVRSRHLKK